MNPRTIKVRLSVKDNADVLIFFLDDDAPDEYIVNLNSESSQGSLKHVFSKLLTILVEEKIVLVLEIDKDYKKGLYKDVCEEYIKDLNRELLKVRECILKELK